MSADFVAEVPEQIPSSERLRFSWRIACGQWAGNLVLILLAVAWLQIPDSHLWQFVCSVVAAVAIAVGFVWLQRATFARLLDREKKAALWVSFVSCALLVLVGISVYLLIEKGRGFEFAYGSLWNSKLPRGPRAWLTFERLVWLQDRIYDLLEIAAAGVLVPLAIEAMGAGAGPGFWRRILSVYRRWRYWLAALIAGPGGWWVTSKLLGWVPGQTVWQQVASVAARLAAAYTLDTLLWCLMLAAIARYLNNPGLVERLWLPWRRKGL